MDADLDRYVLAHRERDARQHAARQAEAWRVAAHELAPRDPPPVLLDLRWESLLVQVRIAPEVLAKLEADLDGFAIFLSKLGAQ